MDISAAGILVVNNNGEVLVLHRKDFVPEGNLWGLPGGHVAPNQRPIDAAKLKVVQEVGLEFDDNQLSHLGEFEFVVAKDNILFNVWVAHLKESQSPEIKLNPAGHDDYKWGKPEELVKQKDLIVGLYSILEKYLN